MAASIEIKTAETDQERQRIYRFRYEVYVDEMGKKPRHADHIAKTITDDLDEAALLLYAEADGQLVGTVRLNYRGRQPFPESWESLYHISTFAAGYGDQISMTSRLMVAKDWRGSSVSGLLVAAVYNAGREMGSRFDFCNCAPSLIEFYEQIGFRRFAPGFLDEDNGYRVPLVMVVRDLEHLKTVRSPLYRVVRHLEHEPETGEWFRATFPTYAATGHARSLGPEEFWAQLSEHLSESPAACVPLF